MIERELAAVRLTVNVAFTEPVSGSVTVASLIEIAGCGSLSTIVPSPVGSRIAALTAFDRLSVYVSSSSSSVSPTTGTVTVFVFWPGANVSVPLVAA